MKLIETDQDQRINTLRGNSYFTDLPEPLLKEIAAYTQLREYQRGDVLFWEADPGDGLHIVERGSAKIYRLSPQGRQYIVRILQEGDIFAEVPAFDGGMNPVNVDALELCRVWVIQGEKLRALVATHPPFAQKVLLNFGEILRGLVRGAASTLDSGTARGAVGDRARGCRPFTQGIGTKRRDPHQRSPHPN